MVAYGSEINMAHLEATLESVQATQNELLFYLYELKKKTFISV